MAESEEVVIKLANDPELQLEFIENVLNVVLVSNREKALSEKEKHSLAVFHLQIVVQNKIDQLENYI